MKFFIDGEVNNPGFNVLPGGIKIDNYLKNYKNSNYGNYEEDSVKVGLNQDSDVNTSKQK